MKIIIPDKDVALNYALDELDYSYNLLGKAASQEDINKTISYINDVYDNNKDHKIFSIENQAIAIIDIDYNRKLMAIECCYTNEASRGKGYASALLKYIINYKKEYFKDFQLVLVVVKTNYKAKNVYASNGFVVHHSNDEYDWMSYRGFNNNVY